MLKHIKGDIFKCDADIILHQVNCQGVMGSGVAKQVRDMYPEVYEEYRVWCDVPRKSTLLGKVLVVQVSETQYIGNLFAQERFGYSGSRYTDYDALKTCLETVNAQFAGKRVAIPYLMGCYRGGGDWSVVSQIIKTALADCDVTLYEYNGK